MTFILRMAARELRASWRRLVFFFVCVALGVAAIVALRSIIQSVRTGLMGEARATIASDVLIQTNRAWTPPVRADLESRLARAPVLARNESIEMATMVRAEHGTATARMIELRGVETGFPFYGTLLLERGARYSHDLLRDGGALVRPELLAQLGVGLGDRIVIGGQPFTIRGLIAQEPGRRVGGFSLGTRVLVDLADLRKTGLLTYGSRANYQILLKVRDDGVDPLRREIAEGFRDRFVNARSYRSTEDQIGESLARAEDFLSLVGFVIVVLGGIGVWSVTRVFVRQKIRSVAILKCVGASTREVLATYVLQVGVLALAGSLLGVVLAALAMRAIPEALTASLGGIPYGLTSSAVAQGVTVGLLVSLLFALVPLLDVRNVKPLLLLRGAGGDTSLIRPASDNPPAGRLPGEASPQAGQEPRVGRGKACRQLPTPNAQLPQGPLGRRELRGWELTASAAETSRTYFTLRDPGFRRFLAACRRIRSADWLQIWTALLVTAALVGVASWQAASWKAGGAVSAGFALIAAVLYGAAFVLVRALRPLTLAPWFPLRHAVVNLRRPGNQTRVILLAVGLGSFFVLGVRAVQDNLIAEFVVGFDRGGADMFLIDVQRDQVSGVRALSQARQDAGAPPARLVPVLRARVTAVRGKEVNLDNVADVRGRGSLAREYTITYRLHLEQNETITLGRFWTDPPAPAAGGPEAEVSIEESIHERFAIGLGDQMRFDVAGRQVQARVTSVRHVEWGDSRSGGFMFVFRPGPLDEAPQTFVGFLKAPADTTARARLQYDLVARYPNVTAVDGREIIERIQKVIDNAVLAISIVGGIALLSGLLILIGAVAMTRFQRVYESAILRTLGAGTQLLTTMVALEYSALGLLAGLIGAAGALGLSWAVARHVLDIPWRPAPVMLTAGAVMTMLLVGTIGVIASADVLRKKPLATLRAE